jgi:copper homeostasis protein
MLVEAAVESIAAAIAAERSGAGRVELCTDLDNGGTTPRAGVIGAAKARIGIPVFVLIRPRGGGFVYSEEEIEAMRRDVEIARSEGAAGIVTGALGGSGRVDVATIRMLVDAAGGLPVTFHRAFDAVTDSAGALEMLIEAGVSRVLTSGGANTALEGVDTIARLVEQSNGRIIIVAGGGIREHNAREVIARSGVTEIHARLIDEAGMTALVGLSAS